MVGLADSDAVLDRERLLTQHQAALTLLQRALADPAVIQFKWLDLACGKGQIIAHLEENLEAEYRSKISYTGYDLNVEHGRLTQQRAARLGFSSVKTEVGDLGRFDDLLDGNLAFDFITLTNAIHEIDPSNLPAILLSCLTRLSNDGSLFVYDMETLPSPELGAVPWKGSEFASVLSSFFQALGVSGYTPPIGRWMHRSCRGWNTLIEKRHIVRGFSQSQHQRDEALAVAAARIVEILERRERECGDVLESLTLFGSSTGNEQAEETAALYEYWALQRALRRAR